MPVRVRRSEAFPGQPGYVYRVDHGAGYFVPHAGLLVLAGCFGCGAADTRGSDRIVLVVIAAVLTAPLVLAVWLTLPTWNDELTIFREGFEYRRHGRVSGYRWSEIDDIHEQVGSNRRLLASAVTLRTGERLRFAYRMRGLDLLSQEYDDQLPLDDPDPDDTELGDTELGDPELGDSAEPGPEPDLGLGDHRATYHVRRGRSDFLLIAIFGGFAALMLTYLISEPGVGSLVCFAPFGAVTLVLVWGMIAERRDELVIYEHGFAFRDRKGTHRCRWDEIEDFRTTRHGSLSGLKKIDGPWIIFSSSMQGLDEELKPHARTLIRRVERPDETP